MGKYNPEYKKKYYQNHKEEASEYWAGFYEENSETLKEKQKRQYREKTAQYLFYAAHQRAKKFNIPFNIEKEDVVIPEVCPIFKTKFEVGHKDFAASLDKIIPSLGYVKGNVAIISRKANRMKQDNTLADLKLLTAWLESQ
jgi:hypothetical protein